MTAAARDIQAALFANEAFYRAFADRDIDAMDALWARGEPVLCIHPGWPPTNLFRREAGGWKLFHHQASPAPGLPERDPDEPPPRPH